MQNLSAKFTQTGIIFVRIFGYIEIFLLFGLQFYQLFINLYEIDPRHYYDYAGIIAPIILIIFFGILSKYESYRKLIRKFEWILHITTASLGILLIELLRFDSIPYSIIPLSLRFFIWIAFWSSLIISNMAMNLDKPGLQTYLRNKETVDPFLIALLGAWAVFIALLTQITNPVTFWITCSIFHSIMIFVSRMPVFTDNHHLLESPEMRFPVTIKKDSYEIDENRIQERFEAEISKNRKNKKNSNKSNQIGKSILNFLNPQSHVNELRIIYLIFMMFQAWNNMGLLQIETGILWNDMNLILSVFYHPLFYAGLLVAILTESLQKPLIGDSICYYIIIFSETTPYLGSEFILGYILTVQLFMLSDTAPMSASFLSLLFPCLLSLGFATFIGTYDLITFDLTILFDVFHYAVLYVYPLRFAIDFLVSIIKFIIIVIKKNLSSKNKAERRNSEPSLLLDKLHSSADKVRQGKIIHVTNSNRKAIMVLALVWGVMLSPLVIAMATSHGSPYIYNSGDRIEVGEQTGMKSGPTNELDASLHEELEVNIIRKPIRWRECQWSETSWYWTPADTIVSYANAHNYKLLIMLEYGNPTIVGNDDEKYIPPEAVPLWLEYVNITVRRYINEVYAWEIWNEPNHWDWWHGTNEEFFYLFNETRKLLLDIREETGVPFLIVGPSTAFSWPSYFQQMWEANIMEGIDVLSIHPYNAMNENSVATVIKQNLEMAARYDSDIEIWITEIGSATDMMSLATKPHDQIANRLIRTYALSASLGVDVITWFKFIDEELPGDSNDVLGQYGLLYANYTWKESAYAYYLYSHFCTNTTICPDLLNINNNLAAKDVTALLYRSDSGQSTLLMWYDSSFTAEESVTVNYDLSAIDGTIFKQNITNGLNETLETTGTIIVGDEPVMITFMVDEFETSLSINVNESNASLLTYLLMYGHFIGMISMTLVYSNKKLKKRTSKIQ